MSVATNVSGGDLTAEEDAVLAETPLVDLSNAELLREIQEATRLAHYYIRVVHTDPVVTADVRQHVQYLQDLNAEARRRITSSSISGM